MARLRTPHCTRAVRAYASTEQMRLNLASDSVTPSACGIAPPDRPVPAPRATTGTCLWKGSPSDQAFLQPFGESSALPALHRAGAPAQVVRMRAGHIPSRNAFQRAVVQPGLAKLQAHQRDAQALRGGVAHQPDV